MTDLVSIGDSSALDTFLATNPAALVYFGADDCNVCRVIRPKVWALMEESFAHMACAYVDARAAVDVATQSGVLTVPSVLIYFDGRETLRKERNLSIGGLASELQRPYGLFFD